MPIIGTCSHILQVNIALLYYCIVMISWFPTPQEFMLYYGRSDGVELFRTVLPLPANPMGHLTGSPSDQVYILVYYL